jgi:hypothetical protein
MARFARAQHLRDLRVLCGHLLATARTQIEHDTMIIDCHAHVFQHWQGACGHESAAVHLKYLQKVVTRPAARRSARATARRSSRRCCSARATTPGRGSPTWLPRRRYGQLCFTWEGEDYYVQYQPVGMQEMICPPELMLAQMTYAGVDHCVLQAGGGYGAMNDYNAFTQNQFAGKFTGLLNIDEATADRPETLAEVDRAATKLGLRGLYYAQEMSRHGYARNVDHDAFRPFWDKIVGYKLPVLIELSSTPSYDVAGYLGNLKALDALLRRHPAHPFLLVMGPPVGFFAKDGRWDFRPRSRRSTSAITC